MRRFPDNLKRSEGEIKSAAQSVAEKVMSGKNPTITPKMREEFERLDAEDNTIRMLWQRLMQLDLVMILCDKLMRNLTWLPGFDMMSHVDEPPTPASNLTKNWSAFQAAIQDARGKCALRLLSLYFILPNKELSTRERFALLGPVEAWDVNAANIVDKLMYQSTRTNSPHELDKQWRTWVLGLDVAGQVEALITREMLEAIAKDK